MPNYILLEETKSEEIVNRALKRAIRYEEKARRSDKKPVKQCFRKLDSKRETELKNRWEEGR